MLGKLPRVFALTGDRGFGLVSAILGIMIVVGGSFALLQTTTSLQNQDKRTDRRRSGEQLLAATALDLEKLNATGLWATCEEAKAVPGPAAKKCLTGESPAVLSSDAVYNPAKPAVFAVRLDWNGAHSATGSFCVDLISCRWRGGGHLLELVVNGVWEVKLNNGKTHLANKELTIRKAR